MVQGKNIRIVLVLFYETDFVCICNLFYNTAGISCSYNTWRNIVSYNAATTNDGRWGEAPNDFSGKGLKHIIRKHLVKFGDFNSVEEIFDTMNDLVENGKKQEDNDNTCSIENDNYRLVVVKDKDNNWILTVFDYKTSKKDKIKRKDAVTNGTPDQPDVEAGAVTSNLFNGKGTNKYAKNQGNEDISTNVNEKSPELSGANSNNEGEILAERVYDITPYETKTLSAEGYARMDLYENSELADAREDIRSVAKIFNGKIGNASAGAFNYEKEGSEDTIHSVADAKKAGQIGRAMTIALEDYKDRLQEVGSKYEGVSKKVFDDAIADVDKAIKWYTEFANGEHQKIGEHADDGIKFSFTIPQNEEEYKKKETAWHTVMKETVATRHAEAPGDSENAKPLSAAKVQKIENITKSLDGIIASVNKKSIERDDFLNWISGAIGFRNGEKDKSKYGTAITLGNGDEVYMRVSNHSGRMINFELFRQNDKDSYGIVINENPEYFRDNVRPRFYADKNVDHLELQYYTERFDDATENQRQALELGIAEGIKHLISTGSFEKMPLPNDVNPSGIYKRIFNEVKKRIEQENEINFSFEEEQQKSPEFKNWFGDWENDPENASKVVNKKGEPLVVYHGTLADNLTRFDPEMIGSRYSYDEKGFFFTSHENIANDYATSEFDKDRKGKIIPVYLNLRKPLIVDKDWCLKNGLGNPLKDMDAIEFWDNYQSLMIDESERNDGIIIDDGQTQMYVAFKPNQIKSATENNGEFSKENDDIRFSFLTEKTPEQFDELHKLAVENTGYVPVGIEKREVKVVSLDRHPFSGSGKQALDKARTWASKNIVGVHVANEGTPEEYRYNISEDAIDKFLSSSSTKHSYNLGLHLATLMKLPEIIENSIDAEIHPDYNKVSGNRSASNGVGNKDMLVHRLYGAAELEDTTYRVKNTVKEIRGGTNDAYNYEITKVELPISGSAASDALGNSTFIMGAKLLENAEKSYEKGEKLLAASMKNAETAKLTSQSDEHTDDDTSFSFEIPEGKTK